MTEAWERVRTFIDDHCIYRSPPGEFIITSANSGVNAWQFYLPIAVLDPQIAPLIANLFWGQYDLGEKIQLCGCESGGSLLASVLQLHASRPDIPAFMIKKAAKTYGLKNW